MKRVLISSAVVVAITAMAAASWSQTAPPGSGSDAPPEPITGSAVMPNPGSETIRHDPFVLYDSGGSAAAWSYDDLTADEQAVVDSGRDVTGWGKIGSDWAAATQQLAAKAQAAMAANRLSAGDLATEGVVP